MGDGLKFVIGTKDEFTKGFKQFEKGFGKLTGQALKFGTAIAGIGGTALLVKMAKDVVTVGASFEHSMTRVKVISRATGKEFEDLTKIARKMGATTEWTASQSAEALQFLAMAGLDVNQQLGALPQTLNLATAGSIDLARAADISTNIMKQMGLEVEELTRVNDALVAVQSTANTNIDEAAQAFIYAGTKARAFHVDVEQLSAMIGMMANAGIKASMAGSSLRQAMMKLLDPSKDATKILEQYNIKVSDGEGGIRNFTDILYDLSDANLSAIEVTKLFGARAGQVEVILNEGSDALRKYIQKLKDMEGVSNEAADTMRKSLINQFATLKSAIESDLLDAFDILQPRLEEITEDFIEVARSIGEWVRANDELIAQKVDSTIDNVKSSLDHLISLYNSLPEGVIGAAGTGIIARILTGSTPIASVVAGLSLIDSQMQEINSTLSAAGQQTGTLFSIFSPSYWKELIKAQAEFGSSLAQWQSRNIKPEQQPDVGGAPPELSQYFPMTEPVAEFPGQYQGFDIGPARGGEAAPTQAPDISGVGGGIKMTDEQQAAIGKLSSMWDDYYLTEVEKAGAFYGEMYNLIGDDVDARTELYGVYTAMLDEARAADLEKIMEKMEEEGALHEEQFEGWLESLDVRKEITDENLEEYLEKLMEWYEEQQGLYSDNSGALLALEGEYFKRKDKIEEKQRKKEKKLGFKDRQGQIDLANYTADTLLAIGQAMGDKGVAIAKAGGIAKAIIGTYTGVAQALDDYKYPMTLVVGALIIAQGVAAIAKISSAHGGLTNVPSEQTYLLDRGERVLSPNQNRDLTGFLGAQKEVAADNEDVTGEAETGGSTGVHVEHLSIEILPNATNPEALLDISKEDWRDIVSEKIIPAIDELNTQGAI